MKKLTISLFAAATLFAGSVPQTFTGIITDSKCGGDHSSMHVTPDAKCVRECVKAHAKYVLFDGKTAFALSDQQKPAKFAAQKVTITGELKGDTIEVKSIVAAK